MGQQRRKLWVGIGTCVLLGSTGVAADSSAPAEPATEASESLLLASAGGEGDESGSAGGEGGEGGEASAAGGEAGGEGGEGGEASTAGGEAGGEGGEGGGEGGGAMSVFGGGEGGGEAGGEGGEGGEGASAPSATESVGVYYSQLAFMLGHMQVGRELYEAGDADAGATHLGHPAAEHLPALEGALDARGLGDVGARIRELAGRAGEGGDWSAVGAAYERAEQAVRRAMTDVDAGKRGDVEFLVRVLTAITYKARAEYEAALRDGRFVAVHEYQDGRGFLQVGRSLLERHADTFRAADADAYEEMVDRFEAIMAAWPSVKPPAEPTYSVSELYGLVSSFEFVTARF